ncbi:MAG: hypothetical protein A2428_13955 [Bdellovibrionales bacterium RIFOXYC1_FULL_54_43]|nr:MAG: hypothetical protein A2428_13955 [Bdellovibrionales bacterium RIFOXYC1_FULL_54_43]OFZ85618.1 MAG: hypothetical protein A2603_01390 [Bdellovibrionales bacterium RIFOXYD1_FULL_55_31]
MRWSCPHCGINLALSDEKLGSGWSFSRCYKCGGFALIRRSEVNLIKVDKAPAGENVLLPEATETPVLSQGATQNLEKLMNRPTVKPAVQRSTIANDAAHAQVAQGTGASGNANVVAHNLLNPADLPRPLPELPQRARHSKFLPVAIGVTGTLAVASGMYLFSQGQALWKKARATAIADSRASHSVRPASTTNAAPANDVVRAPTLISQAVDRSPAVISDQVHQNAMAPVRSPAIAVTGPEIIVTIKVPNSKLHTGPGLKYPVMGIADPGMQYAVVEWKNEWFKIAPKKAMDSKQAQGTQNLPWIRNDLVQLVSSNARP